LPARPEHGAGQNHDRQRQVEGRHLAQYIKALLVMILRPAAIPPAGPEGYV
jgi:hypothetical protein